MADIVGNQQISASKRSWADSLDAEIGSEKLPGDRQDHHEVYQPKRSRNMPDGETQMDDYEISNGSLPSCYESGSDSAEKPLRSDRLFHNHISSNEDLNSGESPTTSGRPPDGYEDPASSSHSTDSNFYDEVENGSPDMDTQDSPPSPAEASKTSPATTGEIGSNDDQDDDEDNVSTISDLSGISIEGWRPVAGPISWVQRQMRTGVDPRTVLKQLVPKDALIPEDFDDLTLWKIVINLIAEPPKRSKLKNINTLDDVLHLLRTCKKIMVLTGAGVSVSCGIPDFRSRDGIYSRLAVEYPDLPDPQAMFDICYFRRNPKPFFKFAKEIYPGQFMPSPSHRFISLLESKDKLLRNYTQNIDTLEQVADINNVIQCHGSFATATCMMCKYKVDKEVVKEDIMNQVIPRCPKCPKDEEQAIMKPDIVFFGESLPSEFHRQMEIDRDVCDLLIVIGSSLKVRPVALIPNSLPAEVPQILINREPLRHLNFDVELLGDCDVIVNELCHQLGIEWESICTMDGPCQQVSRADIPTPPASRRTSPRSTPNSEDNSRMSFQVSPDESSQMSTSTTQNTDADISQQSQKEQPAGSVQPKGMVQNDSTASLCTLVGHMSTTQKETDENIAKKDSDVPTATNPQPTTSSEKSNEADEAKEEESKKEMEKTQEEIDDLEELRACWQPRIFNLAARLKEGTYLYMPPCRYVFHGAEVYDDTASCSDDEQPEVDSDSESSDSDSESAIPAHHSPQVATGSPSETGSPTESSSLSQTGAPPETGPPAETDFNNIPTQVCFNEMENTPSVTELPGEHGLTDTEENTDRLLAEFTASLSQSAQDTLTAAVADS